MVIQNLKLLWTQDSQARVWPNYVPQPPYKHARLAWSSMYISVGEKEMSSSWSIGSTKGCSNSTCLILIFPYAWYQGTVRRPYSRPLFENLGCLWSVKITIWSTWHSMLIYRCGQVMCGMLLTPAWNNTDGHSLFRWTQTGFIQTHWSLAVTAT